ncbi:hypothetical protein BDN70DRAFT_708232 [Pholiota conissans]|uniref:MYND-type domain-containing protein n=1 Tax=Pholiota conissans TaxID=109636 RepID=A0A9P5ZBD3_9AGAR|nr:hypothetical protein BDN70DRAFT_708232 [Pholiota conissans]
MSTRRRTLPNFRRRQLEVAATLKMSHPSEIPPGSRSTKDLKKIVKDTRHCCVRCNMRESAARLYKTCGKCHSVYYCSQECQKLDWPSHKEKCPESERKKRVEKVFAALMCNENLSRFLQLAMVLHLGIQNSPLPAKPFTVSIKTDVEPEHIMEFARLRGDIEPSGATNPPRKIRGIPQIGKILNIGVPEGELDVIALANSTMEVERYPEHPETTFGCVAYSIGGVGVQSLKTAFMSIVPITAEVMRIAREAQPFVQEISATGETRLKPMSSDSCIEYINTTIRLDNENRLLLRTPMTEFDETIIRNSAANPRTLSDDERRNWTFMQSRMKNERVYEALLR